MKNLSAMKGVVNTIVDFIISEIHVVTIIVIVACFVSHIVSHNLYIEQVQKELKYNELTALFYTDLVNRDAFPNEDELDALVSKVIMKAEKTEMFNNEELKSFSVKLKSEACKIYDDYKKVLNNRVSLITPFYLKLRAEG